MKLDELMEPKGNGKEPFRWQALVEYLTTMHDFKVTNKSAMRQSQKDIIETQKHGRDGEPFSEAEVDKLNAFISANQPLWSSLIECLNYRKFEKAPKGVPEDIFQLHNEFFK